MGTEREERNGIRNDVSRRNRNGYDLFEETGNEMVFLEGTELENLGTVNDVPEGTSI